MSLIEHGETGLLAPADADALADAVLSLVTRRCCASGCAGRRSAAVRGRTWEASLEQLAAGYRPRCCEPRQRRTAASPERGPRASGRERPRRDRSPMRSSPSGASARGCCRRRARSPRRCCRCSTSRSSSTSSRSWCAAGIARVLFVTGRRKRAIEDHFDADPELGSGSVDRPPYRPADPVHAPGPAGRARRRGSLRREPRRVRTESSSRSGTRSSRRRRRTARGSSRG